MLQKVRERAAIFGDEREADVVGSVFVLHALLMMSFGPSMSDPTIAQLLAFASALVVTVILAWNAGKLSPGSRHQWVKLLVAWLIFSLLTATALTVLLYGSIQNVALSEALGYRLMNAFLFGGLVSVATVGVVHLGYAIRAAVGGGRSSEEIHEAVLEDDDE